MRQVRKQKKIQVSRFSIESKAGRRPEICLPGVEALENLYFDG